MVITADFARHAQFCGTKGEMNVTMGSWDVEDDFIETTLFGAKLKTELIPASELSDDFSGHGGGDIVMVRRICRYLTWKQRRESFYYFTGKICRESLLCSCSGGIKITRRSRNRAG